MTLSNAAAPKPGPALHPAPLAPPAPAERAPYRDLAKHYARLAAMEAAAANEHALGSALGADRLHTAQTYALVSLACSHVAPVARQRLIPCKAAGLHRAGSAL